MCRAARGSGGMETLVAPGTSSMLAGDPKHQRWFERELPCLFDYRESDHFGVTGLGGSLLFPDGDPTAELTPRVGFLMPEIPKKLR